MKKRKIILAAGLIMALLAGCGSTSKFQSASVADTAAEAAPAMAGGGDYLYDNGMSYDMEASAEEAVVEAEQDGMPEVQDPLASRKLITTMNLSAETEHFDELMTNVEKNVSALGGYIENSDLWNNNHYSPYGNSSNRNASMIIRIPAEKLNEFITLLEEGSNITRRSKSVEDVTLAYVDLESHKKALLTEQDRLLELMEMAETVEDLIALEDKLANVRYQLESMESQLRTYDNRINYSTIYLDISEVQRLTPEEELTTWGKIKTGFAENVYRVGTGIRDFFINLLISIPYILVGIVALAVVFVILFLLARREKKKKEERRLKKQQREEARKAAVSEKKQKKEAISEKKPEDSEEKAEEDVKEDDRTKV